MSTAEVERFRRRLELLASGRLQEARTLTTGTSKAAKKKAGELASDIVDTDSEDSKGKVIDKKEDMVFENDAANVSGVGSENAREMGPRSPATLTSQTLEAMINTVGEFFRRQPTGKCQNCGAHNPTVKREGFSKIFVLRLPAKKQAANATQGTPILQNLCQKFSEEDPFINSNIQKKLHTSHMPMQGDQSTEEKFFESKEEEDFKRHDDITKDDIKQDDIQNVKYDADENADVEMSPAIEDKHRTSAGNEDKIETDIPAGPQYLTPTEVREILGRLWRKSEPILSFIYPTDVARRERRKKPGSRGMSKPKQTLGANGYLDFFVQTVPVAPNRFRPVNHVGDAVYEHPQNTLLSKLINGNLDLIAASKGDVTINSPLYPAGEKLDAKAMLGRTLRLWLDLQNSLNALFDSSAADETHGVQGIRQQLEKKEGLFRKNMMGKRVNFAARSVISPDVYLNGGEIGVPPYFASRLSFPERVTPWNVERLREAVLAGPGRNPGAIAVEDERGRIIMLRKDKKSREAVAKTLYAGGSNQTLTPQVGLIGSNSSPNSAISPGSGLAVPSSRSVASAAAAAARYGGGKVVYRTMQDGDFMLTNRQPTLHKPGMMGHRARIMRAERTIRFHYANCSTFNADFDGDEINLHLPQDHLGRAEGYDIVHADHQFFVPTDGKPLRGLIQDHIVAGTLLTMKDRFLTQHEYCQLIYECIAPDCSGSWDIWMEPPTILAPQRLWTGKQVITAILMHYTRDQLPFHMAADCKIPADVWGKGTGEGRLHIYRNHLITGCIDKSAFGKHGLLHIFHVRHIKYCLPSLLFYIYIYSTIYKLGNICFIAGIIWSRKDFNFHCCLIKAIHGLYSASRFHLRYVRCFLNWASRKGKKKIII